MLKAYIVSPMLQSTVGHTEAEAIPKPDKESCYWKSPDLMLEKLMVGFEFTVMCLNVM